MMHCEYSTLLRAPVERVFGFHEQPDAIERLTPPWQKVRVVRKSGGLQVGAVVEFQVYFGPVPVTWIAHHIAYKKNEYFVDEQRQGPFSAWVHTHLFQAETGGTRLTDSIELALPGGLMAEKMAGWLVRRQLARLFAYRHEITRQACEE